MRPERADRDPYRSWKQPSVIVTSDRYEDEIERASRAVRHRHRRRGAGPLGGVVALQRLLIFVAIALVVAIIGATTLNSLGIVTLPIIGVLNPAPRVIPALREWHGGVGSFALTSGSRITIDPAAGTQLAVTAQTFQSDLAVVSGRTLPVVTTAFPASGDFVLTLGNADGRLGDEGYTLAATDSLIITGATSRGVLYGTRTALQILLQDPEHIHIPKGLARDYPKYKVRGFMLDVGRKFFPLSFLEDYVKLMSWFKMNDFHIHFNDNAFGAGDSADWMHGYAAFRLNSPRFPGLAAKDGSYSQQDIHALVSLADAYGVTITPEIDAPAHALAFTQYKPALASPYSKEFLNLGDPNTFTFLNSVWDEFLPWFDSSQVHIGADEYTASDSTSYRRFINTYDTYLQGKGKTVRVWGSLAAMPSSVRINSDVVFDLWDNSWQSAVDTVRQGYSVINANDNLLYIVPKSGAFNDFLNTRMLYDTWEPYIFDLGNASMNLKPNDPHLLGGMFCEWNDQLGANVSDADVQARVKPAMPVLAAKMWAGATPDVSYDQFEQLAKRLGDAPGTHLPRVAMRTGDPPDGAPQAG